MEGGELRGYLHPPLLPTIVLLGLSIHASSLVSLPAPVQRLKQRVVSPFSPLRFDFARSNSPPFRSDAVSPFFSNRFHEFTSS